MRLVFTELAWEEYASFLQRDRTVLKHANAVIADIVRDPFDGIGKPEPLKHQLAGFWSRRLTQEHRIVYQVTGEDIVIVRVGGHYEKS
ncbi:Txe/YoeB family addiction module toxin [Nocardia sp. NBC_01730]|uniref:Txe/YoeB family addiction module toxin n=1 Tax=Nocardia sp. NBC_01730 TaxID=2975998 RepID=UPI002E0E5880|nr:Txe/YoeB family addiction module toxin [Nocardia sp. NBC_01730]